jgi:tetratricopeptide (TPR) repeat protein
VADVIASRRCGFERDRALVGTLVGGSRNLRLHAIRHVTYGWDPGGAMDVQPLADWVRERILEVLPDWLDPMVGAAPDWVLFGATPLVIVVVVGLGLNKAIGLYKDTIKGYKKAGDVLVGKGLAEPSPATHEGQEANQRALDELRAENAAMAAKIDAILAAVSPAAGAEPIGVEAEAAKKGAVVRLVTDTAKAAERATRDIARGDVSGGFDILAKEARAAEAEAANKWRRLGALAVGVDTARARAAYEEAFRLQPEDFWTCVELARLRRKAGDLAASRQAAEAAERAARTDRERSVADDEIGDVLVKAGDLSGAKARFEASLEVMERLAAANPGSAEAQRDVWVSLWRLANMEGSGVTWDRVLARMEEMKARGTLLPTDEGFLEQARQLASG